mmetsp:Transcript_88292/g.233562  ORF Transcript_88292/g.233562 Transcript_88292/m.233562 type:complete len:414 (+) Transcript_88292:357-1598(+)
MPGPRGGGHLWGAGAGARGRRPGGRGAGASAASPAAGRRCPGRRRSSACRSAGGRARGQCFRGPPEVGQAALIRDLAGPPRPRARRGLPRREGRPQAPLVRRRPSGGPADLPAQHERPAAAASGPAVSGSGLPRPGGAAGGQRGDAALARGRDEGGRARPGHSRLQARRGLHLLPRVPADSHRRAQGEGASKAAGRVPAGAGRLAGGRLPPPGGRRLARAAQRLCRGGRERLHGRDAQAARELRGAQAAARRGRSAADHRRPRRRRACPAARGRRRGRRPSGRRGGSSLPPIRCVDAAHLRRGPWRPQLAGQRQRGRGHGNPRGVGALLWLRGGHGAGAYPQPLQRAPRARGGRRRRRPLRARRALGASKEQRGQLARRLCPRLAQKLAGPRPPAGQGAFLRGLEGQRVSAAL